MPNWNDGIKNLQAKIVIGKTKTTPWTFEACKKRIDGADTPEKQVAMWTELNMWVYADGKDNWRWDCYWAFMDAWEKLYKEPEWIKGMSEVDNEIAEF